MEYPVRKLDQRETIQFKNWRNNDQFELKLKLIRFVYYVLRDELFTNSIFFYLELSPINFTDRSTVVHRSFVERYYNRWA